MATPRVACRRVREDALSPEEAVDALVAAWNAETDEERRALIGDAFTDDAVMVGGHDDYRGADSIAGFISRSQRQARVNAERTSAVDAHQGWLRYEWRATATDGQSVDGIDVGELAPVSGRRRPHNTGKSATTDSPKWSQPPPTRVCVVDQTPPPTENDSECGNVP